MSFPEGALDVIDGDLDRGAWGFAQNFILKGDQEISLDQLLSCTVVSDRHEAYQTGLGRVAGGIIGGLLLGPIGAAGGLLAGGKRRIDETIILCRLADGRTFTAQCSQLTAAKFIQFAEINQSANKESIDRQSKSEVSPVDDQRDLVECPMCAELIRARARLCRYCGYKIAEEMKRQEDQAIADENTQEIFSYSELYRRYVSIVGEDFAFTEADGREILNAFAEIRSSNPELSYRDCVEILRAKFGGDYKTPLLDFFREGFRFARSNKQYSLISGGDMLILSKLDWGVFNERAAE